MDLSPEKLLPPRRRYINEQLGYQLRIHPAFGRNINDNPKSEMMLMFACMQTCHATNAKDTNTQRLHKKPRVFGGSAAETAILAKRT